MVVLEIVVLEITGMVLKNSLKINDLNRCMVECVVHLPVILNDEINVLRRALVKENEGHKFKNKLR